MFSTHHQRGEDSRPHHRGIVAGGLAGAAVLLAAVTGLGTANAATGPTVYEQAAYNQNVSIAANNVHTTVSSSPVLAEGTYQVNSTITFNNLTAGSQVLCGWTTSDSGDALYGNYGDAENQDATANTGSCTVTGIAEINNANDKLILWATVYSGPAGPVASSWSSNETPVANAIVSSLT
jgi:hypothetical protein